MGDSKDVTSDSEFRTVGTIGEKGILVVEKRNVDSLSQRGYGEIKNGGLILSFYEALYLLDKELLEVKDEKGNPIDFQSLLGCYENVDQNAWVNFLVYRDLRSRGYVARNGFGVGISFRVYDRGAYSKDPAKYLVMSTQEGMPVPMNILTNAMVHCRSQKKDLVLAVMNRRGEIVYYSVSKLTF